MSFFLEIKHCVDCCLCAYFNIPFGEKRYKTGNAILFLKWCKVTAICFQWVSLQTVIVLPQRKRVQLACDSYTLKCRF